MPSALILLADGTEEMEFVITYDTLVRAGITCTSAFVHPSSSEPASVAATFATCSRGVRIAPDAQLADLLSPTSGATLVTSYDALVIPGGAKGAETLSSHSEVQKLVKEYVDEGKVVGMICAGSLAALKSGLPRQKITSHPSVQGELEKEFEYSTDSVVTSGKLVTSRGPGTAFPFALTLVELLCGKEKRDEIYGPMVFPPSTPF